MWRPRSHSSNTAANVCFSRGMSMDAVEVARLRALADAATPGPWHTVHDYDSGEVSIRQSEDPPPTAYVEVASTAQWPDYEDISSTAEFIAGARAAVPALLDALEQAQEQLEQAQAKLAAVRRDFADEDSIAMWLDDVCSEPEVVAASLCRIDSLRARLRVGLPRRRTSATDRDWGLRCVDTPARV